MTSVPLVPTRTFTGGPDTPSAGLQSIGPLTGAGPDAISIEICSWMPMAVSFWFAWGSASVWLIVTSTEPLLFCVMEYASVITRMPPVADVDGAPVEVRPSPSAVPAAASASVLPAISPGRRARPGPGRVARSSAAPRSCARSFQRFSVNLVIVLVLHFQPGPRPGQALAECDPGDAQGKRRLLRG